MKQKGSCIFAPRLWIVTVCCYYRAASGGHSYMCSALIQQGVMVDARDKEG